MGVGVGVCCDGGAQRCGNSCVMESENQGGPLPDWSKFTVFTDYAHTHKYTKSIQKCNNKEAPTSEKSCVTF